MDEMNVEPVDVRFELGQLIEPAFLFSPVEGIAPVCDQLFQITEVRSVIPAGHGNLVWKPCLLQTALQICEDCFRHSNLERRDCTIRGGSRRRCAVPLCSNALPQNARCNDETGQCLQNPDV